MIIGFTERSQNVSEDEVPEDNLRQIQINVSSPRTSEREHPMVFRLLEGSSTAIVEPLESQIIPEFDALFGYRDNVGDSIEVKFEFQIGMNTTHLLGLIRNDIYPENKECFTVQIIPGDVVGIKKLFSCNYANKYFCEHTICIESDGKYQWLVTYILYI